MRTDTGKVFVKLAKFRFALALVTLVFMLGPT